MYEEAQLMVGVLAPLELLRGMCSMVRYLIFSMY